MHSLPSTRSAGLRFQGPHALRSRQTASGRGGRVTCRIQNPEKLAVPFDAGPGDAPPDYTEVDANPVNKAIRTEFRRQLVLELGVDSEVEEYAGIIDLTRRLNSTDYTPRETQLKSIRILRAMFPKWLPGAFRVVFSQPFPRISCQLNAWVTAGLSKWLMGPSKLNDVEIDGGQVAPGHGVAVERCRYLEQTGCAACCINSCKVPTQEFFVKEMGLPLTMTPNYEDFSCQFSFGLTPPPEAEDEVFATPCFTQCPTKRRIQHDCKGIQPNLPEPEAD
ncbi:hypothetical protein BSKO_05963 [Bryopsis sp. KO-2023]|nr:hypothetical protein BSKO_05963 [Bryopsis sp. KO-2023]